MSAPTFTLDPADPAFSNAVAAYLLARDEEARLIEAQWGHAQQVERARRRFERAQRMVISAADARVEAHREAGKAEVAATLADRRCADARAEYRAAELDLALIETA